MNSLCICHWRRMNVLLQEEAEKPPLKAVNDSCEVCDEFLSETTCVRNDGYVQMEKAFRLMVAPFRPIPMFAAVDSELWLRGSSGPAISVL
jgi:hypothetical protein